MLTDAAMHMASLPPRKRLAMQQQQDCYSHALPRDTETHSLKAEGDVPQQALTPTLLPVPAVKKKRTALAVGGAKAALAPIVLSPEAAEAAARAAALRAKAQAAIQNAVAARQVCAAAWPGGAGRTTDRGHVRSPGLWAPGSTARERARAQLCSSTARLTSTCAFLLCRLRSWRSGWQRRRRRRRQRG